ncbi:MULTISPECIES: ABC transporter substrate-binding protein [unclassified Haladaptatus]|uniref:ABC transporter substrate-binding protein n=1 Tax=unclassified Haladaptatus TaxID=2622732 RepID=UPI00209C253F|nr:MULTISPECIES: ABC transporter substrate-binding protein [unclassified Haladaptatus]MCO8244015.1 ABC transporter substrate-binding protein [Haladaptatus sp. AB643]MCO8255820.1 ABC transporter substrate-binding protein [Haladaptatus sp. AB618]
MTRDTQAGRWCPTRRRFLGVGSGVAATCLLAGCTGSNDGNVGSKSDGQGSTTATETTDTETETTDAADGSYSVSMSPMGKVTFDAVPEDIFTVLTHHAGMAVALGHGDGVNALHAPEYYDTVMNLYYERLDGVSVDWSDCFSSWGAPKEELYELDSDVHLADPAEMVSMKNWSRSDVNEIAKNVGPWFGNSYSDANRKPPKGWRDSYEYYSLWDIFGKVAQVFREEARYEALAAVHADLVSTIESKLPPEDERPTAIMVTGSADLSDIWAYKLNAPGFLSAHIRPLGVTDAFGSKVSSNDKVDFEAMLEANPDVLLVLGGMAPDHEMSKTREILESDPVASNISAVKNDRVFVQGMRYQGPLVNLFQLEMTVKQLYPDVFGEWPKFSESQPYPKFGADEELFDKRRVADIVTGRADDV